MKKLFIIMAVSALFACHGNESAENRPTDQDQTKNRDTSAIIRDSSALAKKDRTDSTRH